MTVLKVFLNFFHSVKLPGPHPVMVSGFGIRPSWHRQIGFPKGLGVQVVPGPQGVGLQGSTGRTLVEKTR